MGTRDRTTGLVEEVRKDMMNKQMIVDGQTR
jgi:hypothetical protein